MDSRKLFKVLETGEFMESVTIPKNEYERMKEALRIVSNLKLYKRLLEFEKNIQEGKVYSRKDLGF